MKLYITLPITQRRKCSSSAGKWDPWCSPMARTRVLIGKVSCCKENSVYVYLYVIWFFLNLFSTHPFPKIISILLCTRNDDANTTTATTARAVSWLARVSHWKRSIAKVNGNFQDSNMVSVFGQYKNNINLYVTRRLSNKKREKQRGLARWRKMTSLLKLARSHTCKLFTTYYRFFIGTWDRTVCMTEETFLIWSHAKPSGRPNCCSTFQEYFSSQKRRFNSLSTNCFSITMSTAFL